MSAPAFQESLRRPGPGRRTRGLRRLLAVGGMILPLGWAGQDAAPNVIMLLVDDMGWDVAALGHPHAKTPNLDRLAAEGRVFEQFYVSSPVCSPTRASFLTGLHPSRFGIHDYLSKDPQINLRRGMPNYLDPDIVTVADLARRAGYRTASVGKWHLRSVSTPRETEYGFDHFKRGWPRTRYFRSYSSFYCVDEAILFLGEQGGPFYINLWFFQMHRPVLASREQKEAYDGEEFSPNDFAGHMPAYYAAMPEQQERFLEYNAVVTSVDAAIGKLLAYLDREGLADNTLIFFTSDNGPEDYGNMLSAIPGAGSSGPFRGRKRSLYEGGIHMPCIVRWPGMSPAGTVDGTTVMSSLDWLPTMCALLGQDPPPNLDGENMLAALQGAPLVRERPLVWDYRGSYLGDAAGRAPRFAIREGHWKLLWEPNRTGAGGEEVFSRLELYNLENDPEERRNLAGTEPALEARLIAKIGAFDSSLDHRPPEITLHPAQEFLPDPGGAVALRVEATGTPPPTYRWYRDGVALQNGPRVQGANSHLLVLGDLTLEDSGEIFCRVSSGGSSVRSSSSSLRVQQAPEMIREPTLQYVWQGGVAGFSVEVRGSEPMRYQWYLGAEPVQDGEGVSGAQSPRLVLAGLSPDQTPDGTAGYSCRVENGLGVIHSQAAPLLVEEAGSADFDAWIGFYTGGEVAVGSYVEDRDGDGWTDFQEFAGVSDPTTAGQRPLFDVKEVEGRLELSYDRWRGGVEMGFGSYETAFVRYDLEVWEDGEWLPLFELLNLLRRETNRAGTGERACYRLALPADRRFLFLRLRVTQK